MIQINRYTCRPTNNERKKDRQKTDSHWERQMNVTIEKGKNWFKKQQQKKKGQTNQYRRADKQTEERN